MKNNRVLLVSVFLYLAVLCFAGSVIVFFLSEPGTYNKVGIAMTGIVSLLSSVALGLNRFHLKRNNN